MIQRLFVQTLKWRLLTYFLLAGALGFVGIYVLMLYRPSLEGDPERWLWTAGILLLISVSVGYACALRFQRRWDMMFFGLYQLKRGNVGVRLQPTNFEPFDTLFKDINELAESWEAKLKQLQTLGEENVLLQTESNEKAVLEERKRLARDLHDTVSQQLFALHMTASTLPRLFEQDLERAKQLAGQLIDMSNRAQKEMRGLIAQLRPLDLAGKQLAEALEKWFPDYCRHNGLQGSLDLRATSKLSDAIEHQLFLIIQEGMANVVKHARASEVQLSLYEADRKLHLVLSDDGSGMAADQAKPTSYGLSTMRERTQKLGGEMEILSRQGHGTRLKVTIPRF